MRSGSGRGAGPWLRALEAGALLGLLPLVASAGPRSVSLEFEPAVLELGLSRAVSGDTWPQDFDHGWRRSAGLEVRGEAGLRLRRGPWESRARLRGGWGEHLPARARWLEASLRFTSPHLALRLGREPVDWAPAPRASLLLSQQPPPLDHAAVAARTGATPLGQAAGEMLIAYLDDPDRAIPYPLLWGMRLIWEPRSWLSGEAQRTVLLGGAGRTRRLTGRNLWDIFRGRAENLERPPGDPSLYPPHDTDQKFAWQVALRPRAWARRHGLDDLELLWVYAGEDQFRHLVPMAPGRVAAARVHPRAGWAASLLFASTVDDSNFWYCHKVYGHGYTYRGSSLGHPMGGDAELWHASLHWLASPELLWSVRVWREERGFFRAADSVKHLEPGGHWGWRLAVEAPVRSLRLRALLGGSAAWGADRAGECPSCVCFGDPYSGRELPEGLFQVRLEWRGAPGALALDREAVWSGGE
jgi:hypothetical protein